MVLSILYNMEDCINNLGRLIGKYLQNQCIFIRLLTFWFTVISMIQNYIYLNHTIGFYCCRYHVRCILPKRVMNK